MAVFVTLEEICSQTAAWEEAVDVVSSHMSALRGLGIATQRQVMCVGCGSTYYLALSAASLLQSRTGAVVRAFPASELLLNPKSAFVEGPALLIAISRSGTTSETLRVVSDFRAARRGTVVVITNYPDSPLAGQGDIVLCMPKGRERSVAQTRSFASMFVAATALADLAGNPAPAWKTALARVGDRLLKEHGERARRLGEDESIHQVFFLGSGPRHGLAHEASLKLKEMSQTVSEPFHFFEFRHGPISMVDAHTLVVGLVSEDGFASESAVIDDVRRLGGRTLTIGEKATDVAFSSGLPDHVRNVLYLPVLQLLAYHRAVARGKNPDQPRNLTAVVELDLGS